MSLVPLAEGAHCLLYFGESSLTVTPLKATHSFQEPIKQVFPYHQILLQIPMLKGFSYVTLQQIVVYKTHLAHQYQNDYREPSMQPGPLLERAFYGLFFFQFEGERVSKIEYKHVRKGIKGENTYLVFIPHQHTEALS